MNVFLARYKARELFFILFFYKKNMKIWIFGFFDFQTFFFLKKIKSTTYAICAICQICDISAAFCKFGCMHVAYVFFWYPESTQPCRGQRLGRSGEEVRMTLHYIQCFFKLSTFFSKYRVRMIGELIRTEGRRSENINVT